MIKYINYIFWGLFFVILDLNINRFDILPDFIGYILAAIGAGGLINSSNQFSVMTMGRGIGLSAGSG
jgi:hypothetical protein